MYAAPPPTIPTCQICCLSICGLIKRQLQASKPPNGRVRQTVGFASVKSFKSDPYFRPLGCPFFRPTLNQEPCTQTHTDTHRGTLCCYRMQTQTNSISINLHRIERDVLILFDFPWIFHEFSAPDRDNEPVFKVWRVEINLKKAESNIHRTIDVPKPQDRNISRQLNMWYISIALPPFMPFFIGTG